MPSRAPNAPTPQPGSGPRRRLALGLVAAVLLAHALLLGRLAGAPGNPSRPPAAPVLVLRQLPAAGPVLADPDLKPVNKSPVSARMPENTAQAAQAPTAGRRPAVAAAVADATETRPVLRAGSARTTGAVALADANAAAAEAASALSATPATAVASSVPAAGPDRAPESASESVPPAPPDAAPPPVYAARPLPPAVLHFAVSRNGAAGRASLRWLPDGTRYTLKLETQIAGAVPAGAASEGELGDWGLAPGRYTESRRGRDLRAVNFQPDAGRISFSRPAAALAWLPGAQDRLSWLLQLPAVLEAEPALRRPGAELQLLVAGTWGHAELWRFAVLGADEGEPGAGTGAAALHLRRTPSRPYDVQVDVWLDPARAHLPLRLRWRGQPAGVMAEWRLVGLERP